MAPAQAQQLLENHTKENHVTLPLYTREWALRSPYKTYAPMSVGKSPSSA